MSDQAVVTNTLLVEALLVLAVFWFVVRRAERRRRALLIFVVALAVLGVLEVLAGIETLGETRPRMRVYDYVSKRSGRATLFQFDWTESRILGRPSRQQVSVTWTPASGTTRQPMVRTSLPPDVFADLWPTVVDDPCPQMGAPDSAQKAKIGRSLWEAVCLSRLATTDPAIAAIVSRDRD
jgi:hypothetical protein